ncbi:hypothetical protein FH972_024322 [Carpinus fangiana]|uniref:BRCT domain-containing protein n=1 Tax=Carpinus fangiana TaxID=176857 RepID=A0A5N6KY82_9ROSI|nr:hypothetical protein FH972_024322 [Carpinus fangiana]
MGAVHKLDLTSDVTHLIVGKVDTPKYQYVAKERPDVKVVLPDWVAAVRDKWTEGGDVDIAALEEQYRLPTFHDLHICVTGFEDLDQRSALQQTFTDNGATYHGDLTKDVSHLVAALPKGKKYEFAVQWGIKLVTLEWVRDSIARGMVLEERLYHPTTPEEERGVGSVTTKQAPSPLGKRKLGEVQLTRNTSDTASRARKLRRTASARYESQGDNLWADMGSMDDGAKPQTHAGQEWNEDEAPRRPSRDTSRKSVSLPHLDSDGITPITHGQQEYRSPAVQGIFSGHSFCIRGFPDRHTDLLQKILTSNGGVLLTDAQLTSRLDENNDDHGTLFLVPHQITARTLAVVPHVRHHDTFVTEFWLEKCLSDKQFVDYVTTPLCKPLSTYPLRYMDKLTICPSSFVGVDLLHLKKTVELMGARYDESLHKQTSVLVCNNGVPNMSKLEYALDNRIPVVHAEWFWQCIKRCKVLPFDRFVPQACQDHAKEMMLQKAATEKTQEAFYDLRPPGDEQDSEWKSNLDADSASRDSPQRTALQEIAPEVNSPKKPSSESQSQRDGTTAQDGKSMAPSLPSNHDSIHNEILTVPTAPLIEPTQNTVLNSAIAHLLAQRKGKSTAESQRPTDRRQRKLGRAQSNPSSIQSALSRTLSHPQHATHDTPDDDDIDRPPARAADEQLQLQQPSQSLTYEDPEAMAAREKLMRRMGGAAWHEDDETRGRTKVESIGVVKDFSLAGEEKRSGRRVGARKRGGVLGE